MKNSKIIAVVNPKGGVGKTTTAFNLAHTLSAKSKKVLLIDLDPQSNLTMCVGINRPDNLSVTIFDLMIKSINGETLPTQEDYIIRKDKTDLIPSNIQLSAIEINLVNVMSREYILKDIINQFTNEYDYIIIDCMPALGLLTINALAACDSVLIPVTPQYLSAKGLEMLLQTISRIKQRINNKIAIEGILITMINERTNLSKEILENINEAYSNKIKVFNTKIPISIKVAEANYNSKSIMSYKPSNKVAIAYNNFAEELLLNE